MIEGFFKEHFYISIIFPQTEPETSLSSLSISFENVDTAKEKLPVHILDGLTLSYKVGAGTLCKNIVSVKVKTCK